MCDYTKVVYGCGHFKILVKAWCGQYVTSQGTRRCGVNIVTEERKMKDFCSGTCPGRVPASYSPSVVV